MIDLQLINSALMALMILIGAAIALSAAMVVAATISRRSPAPGPPPHGGTRRDLPQHPTPDHDDARELVLL
jgi:hypothetical protein